MSSTPVAQFFDSIARAFARSRALPAFEIALLVLGLGTLALLASRPLRRRRASRAAFRKRADEKGLSEAHRREANALARRVGAEPIALVSQREIFERATSRALGAVGEGQPDAREVDAIHLLRHALGFDRLPGSAPLLATRELTPGLAIRVGGSAGQVLEVSETSFTVLVAGPAGIPAGGLVELGLGHRTEARYQLRCRLAGVRPGPGRAERLVFAHDEAPVRIQERNLFRVPAEGPVRIEPVASGDGPGAARAAEAFRAELVDLSAGGALVSSRTRLSAGLRVKVSLAVGRSQFQAVPAVVLRTEPGPEGQVRMHLAFRDLDPAERERMVQAVTRLELEVRAESRLGT